MKYFILVMAVACLFMLASISTAQVVNPIKTTENKTEQKVNQNVDQSINKGLNSIESGVKGMFKKKDKNAPDSSSGKKKEAETTSTIDKENAKVVEQEPASL